ncbi:phenylalanine--tRNA ligase beta subunit, putative [Plasmodium gallinaceum]|uniref:Phenylalanine--tRNA ligase beta subunit n=1 Tax=Plasmodium gallinaceum TaxID=5849 RepID=A0A1J1GUG2_PLAGA|nr:phenylalanine--tRNA ligase beta subunit, putative [Plasmodium gallinaceum]CRG96098.1 phenylalanine--tRNA ligase beta subunit, putative [Plasmodium gallinaceum]
MPTISVYEEELIEKIGENISETKLKDLCFDFGLEIDEVEYKNDKKIYKIEVPANRYDLICVEGLGRALKNFLGNYERIKYELLINDKDLCLKENQIIRVHESVDERRGYVVSCALKNMKINENVYNNIIELQEKLHHNIGKKRSILAIGIHDYDKIKFPLEYKFEEKEKINFTPLNEKNNLNGSNLLNFYENNLNLKPYLKIIKDFERYPIIVDADKKIISLPPIINCDHTKITLNTKNIFIECTAIDKNKAEIALNILCSMLSEYCTPKYSIYSFLVKYDEKHELEKGSSYLYPLFQKKMLKCDIDYVRKLSGISDITIDSIEKLLKKMMISINVIDEFCFNIEVPFYRSDIMHCCDIIEDIAIAYGYGNILPQNSKFSKKNILNTCSDLFKNALVECGYTEVMTNTLVSKKENYDYMLRNHMSYDTSEINMDEYNPLAPPVQILNSKTSEYEIVRTSLIVNLLKFVSTNKHRELPLRFFEIGDVAYTSYNMTDTNAVNKRHLSVIFADKFTAGLEELHGILEAILKEFNLFSDYKIEEKKKENIYVRSDIFYKLIPKEDFSFLNERIVDIILHPFNLKFGVLGVIHPKVLENFSIDVPVSTIEINIQTLMNALIM